MSAKITALVGALTIAPFSGSAFALDPISSHLQHCRVIGAAKLPAAVGGTEALCTAIERAIFPASPGAQYRVEVKVASSSSLAATIRAADGRVVLEQKMAVSDTALTKASIDRFARAIGAALANARSR